jgi:hypothetical protein
MMEAKHRRWYASKRRFLRGLTSETRHTETTAGVAADMQNIIEMLSRSSIGASLTRVSQSNIGSTYGKKNLRAKCLHVAQL